MGERTINTRRNTELFLLVLASLPVLLLYGMYLFTNNQTQLTLSAFAVPILLFVFFIGAHVAVRLLAPEADAAILPLVFLLSGVGITFVTRLVGPDAALTQVLWLFVSVVAMVVTLLLVPSLDDLAQYKYTIGVAGIALLLLPMFVGTEISGAKLWIVVGSFSFQPGELAKVLIVLFLAAFFAENREALSASELHVGPLSLPRPSMYLPLLVMWGISLLVVIFERDLGSALLFFAFFVVMLYVCTGRASYAVFSLLLLAIGGVLCYHLFGHVQIRVQNWINPFQDRQGAGYQIIQSLYSLADGGMVGMGIGRGLAANTVPVVASDFIFSAIGEEMGLLGGSAILICYLLLSVRGLATAARAKSDLSAFVAVGLTAAIVIQAFVIVGGVTKLLPNTGVTLPFMSQGGSSLLASFIIVGLLLRAGHEGTGHGARIESADVTGESARIGQRTAQILHGAHVRGRYDLGTPESGLLGRVALSRRLTVVVTLFVVMFATLITNLAYVQVIDANRLQSLPYNNHTIMRSAYVQRGAIITSDGVTLAESVRNEEDGTYERQHPQGNLAIHTVGYISTTYGTSGVESWANRTLTGHSDYSNLNNTLHSLAGSEVPGSSVVLTLNSQMQWAAEQALAGYTGAVVVLDPTTGAVLAKASTPSFDYDSLGDVMSSESGDGSLLDRSTSVLYAPGSTFKTITLAAALELGIAALDTPYPAPATLDVGGAPITNYHGDEWDSLTLLEAFAYSANTVYAQVGGQIGPDQLVGYANAFGYGNTMGQDFSTVASLMPAPAEMTEWETAWAADGQPVGEHPSPAGPMTTAMQNAVVAATIANSGVAMNPYVIDHVLSPEGTTTTRTRPQALGQPISAETAALVKAAMLSVVEEGTGVAARVGGVSVAGKTGTAETSTETANSLFIGFAPYDSPTLAISVVIEQVDDGSVNGTAAAIAGEVLAACLNVQAMGAV
jgi:peptidoglycan glycosyltransferase